MLFISTATESRIDWWSLLLPVRHPLYTMVTLSKGFSPPVNRHSCGPNADSSCETWGSSSYSLHLFLPSSLPSLLPLMIKSLNAPSDAIFGAFWKIWRVVWDKYSGIHWLFFMSNWCLLKYINSSNIHTRPHNSSSKSTQSRAKDWVPES